LTAELSERANGKGEQKWREGEFGEGGRNRGREEKGHAAQMNVCCFNGKFVLIAVL